MITKEDLEGLKSPIAMACAGTFDHPNTNPSGCAIVIFLLSPRILIELTENDQLFPDDVRVAGQKFLEEQGVEHEMKVYPGAPHGEQLHIMLKFRVNPGRGDAYILFVARTRSSILCTNAECRFCGRRRIRGSQDPRGTEISV